MACDAVVMCVYMCVYICMYVCVFVAGGTLSHSHCLVISLYKVSRRNSQQLVLDGIFPLSSASQD